MKRNLLIISMLLFAMNFMAQEVQEVRRSTEVIKQDTVELKGAHPWRNEENEHGIIEDYTHWSIAPLIGFNVFDGDFNSESKHAFSGPSFGAFFDYSFTPVWGIHVEYLWSHYKVTGKDNATTAATLLRGDMHKLGLGLNMDIISLFFPLWHRKLFCGFPSVGAGYMWYKNSVMYPDISRFNTANYINSKGENGPESMDKYKGTFYIQLGVAFEVNLNRTFGIGARATYSYLMNDYTDNRGYATDAALASKNNDGIFDVAAYLRIKFNPLKRTHTRNVYSFDSWRDKNKGNGDLFIERDTVIVQRHDSVIVRERVVEKAIQTMSYYVYFANNSYELSQSALFTIQQASDRMYEDPSLYAIITGYCDNTGTNAINNELGNQRAHAVIEVLRDEYGVPESHMFGIGQGIVTGMGKSVGAYGANRRTHIRLVDRATYIRMRIELEEKRDEQMRNQQNRQ